MSLVPLLLVASGGAIGAMCRFGLAQLLQGNGITHWVAIMLINSIGAFFTGVSAAYLFATPSPMVGWFILTGILGGFTTFSAFALDAALMLEKTHILPLTLLVTCSITGTVIATLIGLTIGRNIW